ncbi:COMMD8 [Bugula neritina]|uniref:COMMD8 n=1 Tax=Bugula neritina TaxID=10212 RepID=A0A7J7KRH9_BUGNE|nr:COMMD8 [Bugula neritina]
MESSSSSVSIEVLHSIVDRLLDVGLPAPSYSDYSEYWKFDEWTKFIDYHSDILLKCSCSNDVITKLRETSGDAPSTQALIEVLKVRQPDLRRAAANHLCKQESSYLKDFDWQLQLVLGSDKVSSIEEPAIEVLLDIQEGDNSKTQALEFNSQQMDNFIDILEKINEEVLQKQL